MPTYWISHFRLSFAKFTVNSLEDLENIDFAFQIVFLCCLQAEIYLFKVKFRSGVRGVMSPYLFTRYIKHLLITVSTSRIGCNIGGLVINILAYADDIVLMAPSWCALQERLFILENCCSVLDVSFNAKKTVCMNLCPRDNSKIVTDNSPSFTLCGQTLEFVPEFRYLGHIINGRLRDDNDINRAISNMYVRTIMLIRRFGRCSRIVKIRLFRTYCTCLYGSTLWSTFTETSLRRFRSCYHKCIKMCSHYERQYSVTSLLLEVSLPSFDSLLFNFRSSFNLQWKKCSDSVIARLKLLMGIWTLNNLFLSLKQFYWVISRRMLPKSKKHC